MHKSVMSLMLQASAIHNDTSTVKNIFFDLHLMSCFLAPQASVGEGKTMIQSIQNEGCGPVIWKKACTHPFLLHISDQTVSIRIDIAITDGANTFSFARIPNFSMSTDF